MIPVVAKNLSTAIRKKSMWKNDRIMERESEMRDRERKGIMTANKAPLAITSKAWVNEPFL